MLVLFPFLREPEPESEPESKREGGGRFSRCVVEQGGV